MDTNLRSRNARIKIITKDGWLAEYNGQECDAIIYDGWVNPQLNTEQLNPPLPKYQSCKLDCIEEVKKCP